MQPTISLCSLVSARDTESPSGQTFSVLIMHRCSPGKHTPCDEDAKGHLRDHPDLMTARTDPQLRERADFMKQGRGAGGSPSPDSICGDGQSLFVLSGIAANR